MTDGKNVAFALGGLNLTTRDYAKFGQMFLQGGEFGGQQVVPSEWVKASTIHSAPTMSDRDVGYGYQWWIPMPQEGPNKGCLLYTSPSPRDATLSRMPSSA